MCGICGELKLDENLNLNEEKILQVQNSVDAKQYFSSTLISMNHTLINRGPDAEGYFKNGPLQFGHRRLSIIDLTNLAHQPMYDKELGLSLVFNGTIYNYVELREILIKKGYKFKSTGDTEVLLKAFHCWGKDCVHHFTGIFAFAIWNLNTKKIFIARDHFGVKPLYFAITKTTFRFSSTLPSLLAAAKLISNKSNSLNTVGDNSHDSNKWHMDSRKEAEIDLNLDSEALQFYFHLHAVCPAPRTLFKGIRKLGPGEWMEVSQTGDIKTQKYWDLKVQRLQDKNTNNIISYTDEEWTAQLKKALWTAVRRQQLASDVPVGIFLSGGLDSSLLVSIFHEIGVQKIKTFSLGFEEFNGIKADEFEFSDAVSQMYNTDHYKYLIPYSEMLNQIPNAVEFMAEPMFSTDVTAFYLLSQRASKEVKVVHCGQGADEVLGGYFWYPRMKSEDKSLSPLTRFEKHYVDRSFAEYNQMIGKKFILPKDYVRSFLNKELLNEIENKNKNSEFMDSVFHLDVSKLIVDDPVKRIDNMTMAFGIDARVPFLDRDFVELAMKVPPSVKLKSEGKYPLKLMSRGLVPDSVIDRPKGYFPVPVLKFVKGPYFDFMKDILNSTESRNRDLFERSYIDQLIQNPQSDFTPIQGNKLWHLALFELWLQKQLAM